MTCFVCKIILRHGFDFRLGSPLLCGPALRTLLSVSHRFVDACELNVIVNHLLNVCSLSFSSGEALSERNSELVLNISEDGSK